MIKIVGVRFRNAGKIYYFGPGNLDLTAGMHVIVETARGVELGTVMIPTREVNDDSVIQPLKPVIRIATEADEKTALKNREKEKEAFKICLEKIAKAALLFYGGRTYRFPRAGKRSCSGFPDQNRAAPDRCP